MNLNVGYITGFIVMKSLPDYDSYLCKLLDSQFIAQLPKRWARKQYKIGDSDWAAIFDVAGARVTLSQKSPQYVRKILEHLLMPACAELNLKIKRTAWANGGGWHKVAVHPQNGDIGSSRDLEEALKPYLEKINTKDYIAENISFVRYSEDIGTFVVNALCPPGPEDKIYKVIHHMELNRVDIMADNSAIPTILGIKGRNIVLAQKLCKCDIAVKPLSIDTYDKFKKIF
jgi:transcription antitermination factor NusA-like protein